ncbi:hypothetical protein GQ457_02G032250 [Hibiscus cannabinus]
MVVVEAFIGITNELSVFFLFVAIGDVFHQGKHIFGLFELFAMVTTRNGFECIIHVRKCGKRWDDENYQFKLTFSPDHAGNSARLTFLASARAGTYAQWARVDATRRCRSGELYLGVSSCCFYHRKLKEMIEVQYVDVTSRSDRVTISIWGVTVSKLGFGCMRLIGAYNDPVREHVGILIIKHTFDRGITLFDSSHLYGPKCNEYFFLEKVNMLGQTLHIFHVEFQSLNKWLICVSH